MIILIAEVPWHSAGSRNRLVVKERRGGVYRELWCALDSGKRGNLVLKGGVDHVKIPNR